MDANRRIVFGRAVFAEIVIGRIVIARLVIGRIVSSCRHLFVGAAPPIALHRGRTLVAGTVFSEVGVVFSKLALSLAELALSGPL